MIDCYPGQLNQVFMNLLANAIDAIEDGISQGTLSQTPPQIRITTAVTPDNDLTIRIADTGVGIPPEVQSRLFQPFFTTKSVGKGTGLGLSISYQVITETHHGSLQCHSQPGQGTEFVIQIPLNSRDR